VRDFTSPSLRAAPGRLRLLGVELSNSSLENFVDGRRVRADFVCDRDSGKGGGVGDGNGSDIDVAGVFKSTVDARLWRPVVVRRRGRDCEAPKMLGFGVEVDGVDVGVGMKAPFEPRTRNW
jgi:hypothetical protein